MLQHAVIPITSAGCALQSCILPLFSGRVLDDLPVISSIINICLLVKVGLRLCTPYMQARQCTHVHSPSYWSPCSPTQSSFYVEIPAHLSLLSTLYQTCVLPLSLVRLKHQVESSSHGWKSLIKFALKMTPEHFNRVMNMKCCVRPCCICPISSSLIWT